MNRAVVDLGFVLKQIPDYDFSMKEFDDRLSLQKTLYLLQSFGVYLGYNFAWYLRGPYCSKLAADGFELREIYNNIPNKKFKFRNPAAQMKFKKFLGFIKGKSVDDLEIAASLRYLKTASSLSDEEIRDRVANKQPRFTREQVCRIWRGMEACRLIKT